MRDWKSGTERRGGRKEKRDGWEERAEKGGMKKRAGRGEIKGREKIE